MRFAIRDDDTNYFTQPAQLNACYDGIWETVAPTLCLISKVKGNWEYWVHEIYKSKQNTDWKAWKNDDIAHAIEENPTLIQFLKQQYKEGKIDIAFHAKYHRNEDETLPKEQAVNYIRGAEFYTNRHLSNYIKEEVQHLNNLLGCHISVFTPPQNLLSLQGYKSVIEADLNICGGGISFTQKQKDFRGILNIAKQGLFKVVNRGYDYPRTVRYSTHTELPYHYPLQPNTKLETLIKQFDMVRKFDGDFVLSTHYVEFFYPMEHDKSMTMKDVLLAFLDYIAPYKPTYTTLSQMLKSH